VVPINETRMNRIGIAGLVASFVLLILGFAFVIWALNANERADTLVTHSYEVKSTVSGASRYLERAEAARRGYLLDRSPSRLQVFDESTAQLESQFERLNQLTSDNPGQQARLRAIRPVVFGHIEDMRETITLAKADRLEDARALFKQRGDRGNMRRIRAATDEFEDFEDLLLTERLAAERQSLSTMQLLLMLVGLLLMIAFVGTLFVLRRYTRDLIASRQRLHILNTDLEGAVAERTEDLTRANDEIQRFAYIVSHDLRSPLVNILGFTAELETANKAIGGFVESVEEAKPDLVTDTVRFAAKEDLPEAIGFIRTSTQKMDRLINAILDLSRQGRRVLTPEKLPMESIMADIAASLSTQAEERNATIRIDAPLPDLFHDRLAIEQVFSNLLENATKYLAPGRPGVIVVRGRQQGRRAIFEVEDNGRGIAEADRERVFELFRRAGQQDQKGEGIGLANVRALAYRLGGNVSVQSTLGEGSVFTVNLPTNFSGEEKP
jgi:signal transduction histidine kinase